MAHVKLTRGQLIGTLAGVILGLFLSALDSTIVSTALPRIVADLNGLNEISWVVTAYLLTSTVTIPLYGKLSDLYGRKPLFMLGMIIFLIGSMLSGLSQNMFQLILFRGLQGLGAGAMAPIAFAIIGDLFAPAQRARYQGLFSGIFGLASVVGPAVGGWLTDNLSWHWIFYVNLPIGIVAITVVALLLPSIARPKAERSIDYLGTIALTAGVVPLLLAMVWGGNEYAWASPQIIGLLAVAVAMTAAFSFIETRAKEPLLPLVLFRNRIFLVAVAVMVLVGMVMYGSLNYIPLFIQGVLGDSATNSGTVLAPLMLSLVVASAIGGQIVARTGRYKLLVIAGVLVMSGGLFLLSRIDAATTKLYTSLAMVTIGIGLGVSMPIFNLAVQNAFDGRLMGIAISSVQFFRQIGGTVGVAILGSLLTNSLTTTVPKHLDPAVTAQIPADKLAQLTNPEILLSSQAVARVPAPLLDALRAGLAESLALVFTAALFVALGAVLIALFLKEVPLRKQRTMPAALEGTAESVESEMAADPSPELRAVEASEPESRRRPGQRPARAEDTRPR